MADAVREPCPWCRGSGLIAPSAFAPEAEKPEPWPDLMARAPWGYPPEVAERYRAILAPSPCPRCAVMTPPAEAVCELVRDDDDHPWPSHRPKVAVWYSCKYFETTTPRPVG